MDVIKNLISQLESATTDPVVKFLVISVSVLIVVTIFSLIIKIIKQLFNAIIAPFRNKEKKKKQKTNIATAPPSSQFQPEKVQHAIHNITEQKPDDKAHLQEAHAAIQKLNNTLVKLEPDISEPNLPNPISINNTKPSFSEEMLLKLECTEISDETTQQIIKSIEGKGVAELENELTLTKAESITAEAALKTDKNNYLKLIDDRKNLLDSETDAVKAFNKEITSAEEKISSFKSSKQTITENVTLLKEDLLALVDAEHEAEKAFEAVKKEMIEKSASAKNLVDSVNLLSSQDTEYEKIQKSLADKHLAVEKISADLTVNDAEFTSLTTSISANNKKIAENQLKTEIITAAIERIKEEEKRQAEQKAKEEAEARQAKILEEARKLEEEHRLEEERRKEEARLKAEQAENAYIAPTEPLTEDQEVEQARAMMEAQRARRRQASKASSSAQSENTSQSSQPIEQITEEPITDTKPDITEPEPPIVEQENVKKVTKSNVEDPMKKIKAGWEREHDIRAALEAGNMDEAISLANKKGS